MLTVTCNVSRRGIFALKDVPARNAENWAEAAVLCAGSEERALERFNASYVIAGQEPARQYGEELIKAGIKADSPEFAAKVGEFLSTWEHTGKAPAKRRPATVRVPKNFRRMSPEELANYFKAQGLEVLESEE